MKRPTFLRIPCGKVLGHGESCVEGRMCIQCEYIEGLEKENEELKDIIKMGQLNSFNMLKIDLDYLSDEQQEIIINILNPKEGE